MNKPLFKLDDRLYLCASFVRPNSKLVDVGTDHAYLPVWLYKSGIINSALAVDINLEPLKRGSLTIEKYNAQKNIKTRLSNGLQNVSKDECSDIVIAGMGGELISTIIDNSKWVLDSNINLILQPMTKPEKLREYLYNNNIEIIKEEAVIADKKIYSVIKCSYNQNMLKSLTVKDMYIGKLSPLSRPLDMLYIDKTLSTLNKKKNGLEKSKNQDELNKINKLIEEISSIKD